tara:strand:- start:7025 stop:7978 length:954 start_codon:yes stop_codon:yes gene_type:complete
MNKILITGCAGFIGSNLVNFFLSKKYKVIGLDNLSTGKREFLKDAFQNKNFTFHKVDLLKKNIEKYFINVQTIFHLAANADVRFGLKHRDKDIKQNILVTHNILEAMIKHKVKKIAFSSTGSVYGESDQIPTKENCPFPIQTSLYGASKLSAESLISAYCEGYNIKSYIFRFVSILGEKYSHGHVYDFIKQLKNNKKNLIVLGDGNQKKSYLNIKDCIEGMYIAMKYYKNKINIINLGTNEYSTVKDSIKIICKIMNLKPKIKYKGGKRGWVGDNPFIYLDTKKISATGWKPKYTIHNSIEITSNYLLKNEWLFKKK